jgi:hypothetical protein
MSFVKQFVSRYETFDMSLITLVTFGGKEFQDPLFDGFAVSFSTSDDNLVLTIEKLFLISDLADHTILPFSEIKIPLQKVAAHYQTSTEHIQHLFGEKINNALALMGGKDWIYDLEDYLIDENKNWDDVEFSDERFKYYLSYTSINLDKTLDELLSSIIKFDLSNMD